MGTAGGFSVNADSPGRLRAPTRRKMLLGEAWNKMSCLPWLLTPSTAPFGDRSPEQIANRPSQVAAEMKLSRDSLDTTLVKHQGIVLVHRARKLGTRRDKQRDSISNSHKGISQLPRNVSNQATDLVPCLQIQTQHLCWHLWAPQLSHLRLIPVDLS